MITVYYLSFLATLEMQQYDMILDFPNEVPCNIRDAKYYRILDFPNEIYIFYFPFSSSTDRGNPKVYGKNFPLQIKVTGTSSYSI